MFDLVTEIADFILRIDRHLAAIHADYGDWLYAVLFLIVFAQTGLVATPLLPGNSLLFAAGALCARSGPELSVHAVVALLAAAAILGNGLNYGLGARLGPAVFRREESVVVRRRHLERAQVFFAAYGGRALVLSRFVPLARTFMPFAAGVLHLPIGRFLVANLTGGILWCASFTYAGYALGGLPALQDNFDLCLAGLVVVSLLPLGWAGWRVWSGVRRERSSFP
jgi:membrane-associated protein